jgi:hypothetical protein
MLLDEWLPQAHYRERHVIDVHAEPQEIFRAVRDVTPAEMRLFVVLMGLRSLPARLAGTVHDRPLSRPLLQSATRLGFLELDEQPGSEVVFGVAGRFWRPVGNVCTDVTVTSFKAFRRPGHAKAAINFRLDGEQLSTETRIFASDASARRWFGAYWLFVHPGSALIRREWLRAIRRRAERACG